MSTCNFAIQISSLSECQHTFEEPALYTLSPFFPFISVIHVIDESFTLEINEAEAHWERKTTWNGICVLYINECNDFHWLVDEYTTCEFEVQWIRKEVTWIVTDGISI